MIRVSIYPTARDEMYDTIPLVRGKSHMEPNWEEVRPRQNHWLEDIRQQQNGWFEDFRQQQNRWFEDMRQQRNRLFEDLKPQRNYWIEEVRPQQYRCVEEVRPHKYHCIEDVRSPPKPPLEDRQLNDTRYHRDNTNGLQMRHARTSLKGEASTGLMSLLETRERLKDRCEQIRVLEREMVEHLMQYRHHYGIGGALTSRYAQLQFRIVEMKNENSDLQQENRTQIERYLYGKDPRESYEDGDCRPIYEDDGDVVVIVNGDDDDGVDREVENLMEQDEITALEETRWRKIASQISDLERDRSNSLKNKGSDQRSPQRRGVGRNAKTKQKERDPVNGYVSFGSSSALPNKCSKAKTYRNEKNDRQKDVSKMDMDCIGVTSKNTGDRVDGSITNDKVIEERNTHSDPSATMNDSVKIISDSGIVDDTCVEQPGIMDDLKDHHDLKTDGIVINDNSFSWNRSSSNSFRESDVPDKLQNGEIELTDSATSGKNGSTSCSKDSAKDDDSTVSQKSSSHQILGKKSKPIKVRSHTGPMVASILQKDALGERIIEGLKRNLTEMHEKRLGGRRRSRQRNREDYEDDSTPLRSSEFSSSTDSYQGRSSSRDTPDGLRDSYRERSSSKDGVRSCSRDGVRESYRGRSSRDGVRDRGRSTSRDGVRTPRLNRTRSMEPASPSPKRCERYMYTDKARGSILESVKQCFRKEVPFCIYSKSQKKKPWR